MFSDLFKKKNKYIHVISNHDEWNEILPKPQRTPGLRSYHEFSHKSWSKFILRISNKHQHKISTKHQHLHKTSASESRLRINFITSTKHQQQNTDQTSASKSWPNLVLKYEQKYILTTDLHQNVVNTFVNINSNNLNIKQLASFKAIKFGKQQWVSEWVSELVTGKGS